MQANQGLAGLPVPGVDSSRTEAELDTLETDGELPLKQLVCASDGTTLEWCPTSSSRVVVGAVTMDEDGAMFLSLPNGSRMPLAPVIGTGYSPRIGGLPLKTVILDEGNNYVDHAKLLYTLNCYGGDPDVSDVPLMSERFNAGDANAEVIDLNIIGGSAGAIVIHGPTNGYITMVHFAREDSGTYTEADGQIIVDLEAVLCKWSSDLLIRSIMLYIGESYGVSEGEPERYREIIVVGFTAA